MATRQKSVRPRQGEGASSAKDLWDKIAALTTPVATLTLGLLGAYVTWTYNRSDLRQRSDQAKEALRQQAAEKDAERAYRSQQDANARVLSETQTLERLFTFVASPDPQKREFGYAMYAALGRSDLAVRLIELKKDKAGLAVLRRLALDRDPAVSAAAMKSLASLENVVSVGSVVLRGRSSCREFAAMGFRTARSEATTADYGAVAARLGAEPAALAAFVKVEANEGILPDGRPRILFERQVFRRLTGGRYDKTHPAVSGDPGGYGPAAREYERLTEAASLNCPAALASTTWGAFQILGQNYKRAGYDYVDDYIRAVMGSGRKELEAAAEFLRSAGLGDALKNKDWRELARRYNGPRAANEYAPKMAAAYAEATGNTVAPIETGGAVSQPQVQ